MAYDPRLSPLRQSVQHRVTKEMDTFDDPTEVSEDHEAHAAGRTCERCGHELTSDDDVRRNPDGNWVHEACPPN